MERHRTTLAGLPRRTADGNRVFHTGIWFNRLNNARHANLLPRLHRVDSFRITCSERRYVRGIQFRALHLTANPRNRLLYRLATRAYRYGLVTNVRHLPFVRFPVIVDLDDPFFTPEEPVLLGLPNVAAVVVTNQEAAEQYRELGLRVPLRVIGQGIEHVPPSPDAMREVAKRSRSGEVSVGYIAAWHLTGTDRNVHPLYDVDHLLDELWPPVLAACPRARLWLVGGTSDTLRRKVGRRPDIELVGPVPNHHVPTYLSAFDTAIYPRRLQHHRASIKVAQCIGTGVPTIGYRCTPTAPIARAGAGIVVDSPAEFVSALIRVLDDHELRERLASNALAASAEVDWKHLGNRYNELIDEFFPSDKRKNEE